MSIPDFQSLMLPLLQAIGDGNDHSNAEITKALAHQFGVSEEELQKTLPSGPNKLFYNRVAWAKAYLKKAGLLQSPSRTVFCITSQGKSVLAQEPETINIAFLKQFPSMDWHNKKQGDGEDTGCKVEIEDTGHTPEEVLESSYQDLRNALADDLLEQVKGCSPQFFERMVVELLVAMGYGGSLADAGQAIGKTGDGGIDGLIKEDKLGLDFVCVQAKRWENTVGAPVVQAFAGSMDAFKARKGVLITTGSLSKQATDFVKKIDKKIVLIDGTQLAQLMVDHNIGVTTARTYTVKRVDLDYFVEDQE
jgi:restriction system protein